MMLARLCIDEKKKAGGVGSIDVVFLWSGRFYCEWKCSGEMYI